jgi:hypothetical protein
MIQILKSGTRIEILRPGNSNNTPKLYGVIDSCTIRDKEVTYSCKYWNDKSLIYITLNREEFEEAEPFTENTNEIGFKKQKPIITSTPVNGPSWLEKYNNQGMTQAEYRKEIMNDPEEAEHSINNCMHKDICGCRELGNGDVCYGNKKGNFPGKSPENDIILGKVIGPPKEDPTGEPGGLPIPQAYERVQEILPWDMPRDKYFEVKDKYNSIWGKTKTLALLEIGCCRGFINGILPLHGDKELEAKVHALMKHMDPPKPDLSRENCKDKKICACNQNSKYCEGVYYIGSKPEELREVAIQATEEQGNIDDAIDAWHKGDSNLPLHEHLEMSIEEYSTFVEGDTLSPELQAERQRIMEALEICPECGNKTLASPLENRSGEIICISPQCNYSAWKEVVPKPKKKKRPLKKDVDFEDDEDLTPEARNHVRTGDKNIRQHIDEDEDEPEPNDPNYPSA